MVTIRPFDERDRNAVRELWRAVFPSPPRHNDPDADIDRKLRAGRELFLVALDGADVVGTAMAGYDGHRGWVYFVAVHPSHRRKGIGAALMADVESGLHAEGCPKLNLQVRAGNTEAVAFYEQLGFDVEDRVSMAKRLESAPKRR
jgi:ribosomal protein S18 acetylase RimI-like enzyme